MFRGCLKGDLTLSVLVITTLLFVILYIMTSQASLRLQDSNSSNVVTCGQH